MPHRPVRPIILTDFGFQRVLYVIKYVYNYKFGYACAYTHTHNCIKYIPLFTHTCVPTRAVISRSRVEYFRSLGFLGEGLCVPRFRKFTIVPSQHIIWNNLRLDQTFKILNTRKSGFTNKNIDTRTQRHKPTQTNNSLIFNLYYENRK